MTIGPDNIRAGGAGPANAPGSAGSVLQIDSRTIEAAGLAVAAAEAAGEAVEVDVEGEPVVMTEEGASAYENASQQDGAKVHRLGPRGGKRRNGDTV